MRTALLCAAAIVSAAAVAQELPLPPFGDAVSEVDRDTLITDAKARFAMADTDNDGAINVDEFAGHTVVRAALARFNGLVAIDGDSTIHLTLGEEPHGILTAAERLRIDAVARSKFLLTAQGDATLSEAQWTSLQLRAFDTADRNADGVLTGKEAQTFARSVAALSGSGPKKETA